MDQQRRMRRNVNEKIHFQFSIRPVFSQIIREREMETVFSALLIHINLNSRTFYIHSMLNICYIYDKYRTEL